MFAVERTANIKDNRLKQGLYFLKPHGSAIDIYSQKGCCFSLSVLSREREKKEFSSAISAPQR